MSPAAEIIGRLALHPRRGDRLCVVRDGVVLASFAADQDRAAVAAMLAERGFALAADGTVSRAIPLVRAP
jgi:hypothetical protein